MSGWLTSILGEEGFPDHRATLDAKDRLQKEVMK